MSICDKIKKSEVSQDALRVVHNDNIWLISSSGRALSNATPYVNLVNNSNQVSATLMNMDLLGLVLRSEMKTQAYV